MQSTQTVTDTSKSTEKLDETIKSTYIDIDSTNIPSTQNKLDEDNENSGSSGPDSSFMNKEKGSSDFTPNSSENKDNNNELNQEGSSINSNEGQSYTDTDEMKGTSDNLNLGSTINNEKEISSSNFNTNMNNQDTTDNYKYSSSSFFDSTEINYLTCINIFILEIFLY